MYGNVSKAGLAGAAVLPATGSAISPWITIIGYGLLAVTLISFIYLKRTAKVATKKNKPRGSGGNRPLLILCTHYC